MLGKKMAAGVVALTLLSATIVLGATSLIVNGSGIVTSSTVTIDTQKAPPEVELIIGQSGSPANILVITVASFYYFNGNVTKAIGTDNSVEFSGTDTYGPDSNSKTTEQYNATAHYINPNTWTLNITHQDETKLNLTVNGRLQITNLTS
jgi:hypothetical protein